MAVVLLGPLVITITIIVTGCGPAPWTVPDVNRSDDEAGWWRIEAVPVGELVPVDPPPAGSGAGPTFRVPADILFAVDSSVVGPDGVERLATVAAELTAAAVDVVVVGHTDSSGSTAWNDELSLARAEAVRDVLVERWGVPAGSVTVDGRGSGARWPTTPRLRVGPTTGGSRSSPPVGPSGALASDGW